MGARQVLSHVSASPHRGPSRHLALLGDTALGSRLGSGLFPSPHSSSRATFPECRAGCVGSVFSFLEPFHDLPFLPGRRCESPTCLRGLHPPPSLQLLWAPAPGGLLQLLIPHSLHPRAFAQLFSACNLSYPFFLINPRLSPRSPHNLSYREAPCPRPQTRWSLLGYMLIAPSYMIICLMSDSLTMYKV